MSGKIAFLYAVRNKDTGKFLSKSVGNPIYIRQSDATKRLAALNRYKGTKDKYEIVVTEVDFRPIAERD
jgi:hypothetical protein